MSPWHAIFSAAATFEQNDTEVRYTSSLMCGTSFALACAKPALVSASTAGIRMRNALVLFIVVRICGFLWRATSPGRAVAASVPPGPRPAARGHFNDAASDPPGDSAALSCSRHVRRDSMIAFTAERATFHHANGRGSASMLSARA